MEVIVTEYAGYTPINSRSPHVQREVMVYHRNLAKWQRRELFSYPVRVTCANIRKSRAILGG
jgi:hypothetical protein